MPTRIAIIVTYFLVVLGIGWLARTRWRSSPETYFLADRKLGPLVLLGTMIATNFSAFTVFGASGAGYRDGYAFFPIVGFGTGFMALTFWIIGRKAWQIGREHGAVTPPELIRVLYGSGAVSALVAVVMIIFTVPYLALQPMAAGYALEELTGLPYHYGCLLVTVIIVLYTLRGGMRAVAWTDLFQGTVMITMLAVSLVTVARHHGGFVAAQSELLGAAPDLFARPGGLGRYTPGIWMSYLLLWFFADPMFPQLFQRFLAARDERTIGRLMLWYPPICTVVFFLPVAIGVLGHLTFPDLVGKEADRILPMLLTAISGDVLASLVVAAGLAALMSTMDSQLLTLSSIFSRDVLPLVTKGRPTSGNSGRLFVVFLSILGLLMAYQQPATILQIATQTFTGLAVLFPTVIGGLYCRRPHPLPAILSILVGELAVLVFALKWWPTGGVLPVVWVMAATFVTYLAAQAAVSTRQGLFRFELPSWLGDRYTWLSAAVFLLATDRWAWGVSGPLVGGVPAWIWYFGGLSAVQVLIMWCLIRRSASAGAAE